MSNPASDRISTVSTSKGLWAQWRDDIASVFQRDPAARNVLEVLTTYPGVHAVMIHRVSSRLWLRGWRYPARFLSFLGRILASSWVCSI